MIYIVESILALILGILAGMVASNYIKDYPNLDRTLIILISGSLFILSWIVNLPSFLMSLTGMFYIGMLIFLWLKQRSKN